MPELSGRCLCGALTWRATGPVLWAAHCHCEDCRRAAASDYVSWIGVPRGSVTWRGPRRFYASSPGVTRSFCGICGAPASYETQAYPEETHLYAASLDDPQQYQPTAHVFWSERLPWVSIADALPKHPKSLPEPSGDP